MGRDEGMERDRMTHREQRDEKIEAGDPLDETKSITPETETHLGDRREKENGCREGMSKARDPRERESSPGGDQSWQSVEGGPRGLLGHLAPPSSPVCRDPSGWQKGWLPYLHTPHSPMGCTGRAGCGPHFQGHFLGSPHLLSFPISALAFLSIPNSPSF